MAEIQNISIELVKVHPNNVRKTYNDIEELAESIKAKGILQNLTVVPDPQEPGKYLTVIGNRRLTAARMAGLETVPCIVSDMDEKEQTSVMLLENIQRSDLTVYEQAQGFQMMLDLGETEDTIAEKTGFSKKTVRHRLNIAKLDSKTLMEKERQDGYQLSLTDLYELEKIKDVKKMDHQQMGQFCQNLYKAGHADGMKDAEGLTESEVRDVILGVKGIGSKKAEDIVKALTKAQKERS